MTVLTATGVQSETNLPFAGLHQLLHPILGKTNGLPDTQANALRAAFGEGAEAKPDVFMIGLGTLNVLDEQAGEAGLVAIAEDAQWLDQGTGAVLAFVARRLGSHRVSLVVGIRAGFASPLGDIGITEIPLAGLDDEAATHCSTGWRRTWRRRCARACWRRQPGTRWRSSSCLPRSRPSNGPGPSRFRTSCR